jgi:hypothetical protein
MAMIVRVCVPVDAALYAYSTRRAEKVEAYAETVATYLPSTYTFAEPRVGPTGPTHAIDRPAKRSVADELDFV